MNNLAPSEDFALLYFHFHVGQNTCYFDTFLEFYIVLEHGQISGGFPRDVSATEF